MRKKVSANFALFLRCKDQTVIFRAELNVVNAMFRLNVSKKFSGLNVVNLDNLAIRRNELPGGLVELDGFDGKPVVMRERLHR